MIEQHKPSVRVIEPNEKILIAFPANESISTEIIKRVANKVKKFRESSDTVLVVSGLEIYILKDGKQILLADEIEKVVDARLLNQINNE